jgi:hypothetical protein
MKAYGGKEVYPHSFLNSLLDGNEWSVSKNGNLTTVKGAFFFTG